LSTDVVAKGEGVASQPHLQGELEWIERHL
jgi:hypothetical protein